MIPYRELEHTADVGLEIYGNTIDELFIHAVKGLFHLISPNLESNVAKETGLPAKGKRLPVIELSTSTQEELLVHWLNEFIYNFFVKDMIPEIIKIKSLTGRNLRAEIGFTKFSRGMPVMEIKAATYHSVSVKRINGKYQARVIFDV